jgi:hypothetical protein
VSDQISGILEIREILGECIDRYIHGICQVLLGIFYTDPFIGFKERKRKQRYLFFSNAHGPQLKIGFLNNKPYLINPFYKLDIMEWVEIEKISYSRWGMLEISLGSLQYQDQLTKIIILFLDLSIKF